MDGSSSPAPPVAAPPATASPEKPTGNRYDTMFGSDHESASDAESDAGSRKRPRASDHQEIQEEELEDLFGEGSGAEDAGGAKELSDADLASPRPRERSPTPERFTEVDLPRHPAPAPGSDAHLFLMKIPSFLSMEPSLFEPEKFSLPAVDPSESTSQYTKATTSIRVRRNPQNPAQLQSNARIVRWSDGSMSLQIASSPNLYDLPQKDLTTDPTKPEKYIANQDSHQYLIDPHESAGTLRVMAHATRSLNVVSASVNLASDHAIQRLHSELASAIPNAARKTPLEMSELKDPEAERKEAERIAKEREKANKKLEAQRRRARERDPLESQARRSYNRVTGTRSKRDSPPITNSRGRKEDEYDLEDGFIEGSDEEAEEGSDEEESEEEVEERRPRLRRGESDGGRKRRRVVDESDEE